MNPRKLTLSLSLPAVLLLAGGAYINDRQPQAAPVNLQGAVALVDIDACLMAYPPTIARQQGLDKMRKDLKKVIDGMTNKMKSLGDELILLDQNSPAWEAKRLEAQTIGFRREKMAEQFDKRFQSEYDQMRVTLYAEIMRGIEAFAKQTGHQLILRKRPNPAGARTMEVVQANAMREVLYAAPPLDLTVKVTKFLKGWNPK